MHTCFLATAYSFVPPYFRSAEPISPRLRSPNFWRQVEFWWPADSGGPARYATPKIYHGNSCAIESVSSGWNQKIEVHAAAQCAKCLRRHDRVSEAQNLHFTAVPCWPKDRIKHVCRNTITVDAHLLSFSLLCCSPERGLFGSPERGLCCPERGMVQVCKTSESNFNTSRTHFTASAE